MRAGRDGADAQAGTGEAGHDYFPATAKNSLNFSAP